MTATHSQDLQLDHLLCSFGHRATFRPLGSHKCCEICATKSFKIVFAPLLESKGQVKKGKFCFVKCWNVEWPWNWDVTRKNINNSKSSNSKCKWNTPKPGPIFGNFQGQQKLWTANFSRKRAQTLQTLCKKKVLVTHPQNNQQNIHSLFSRFLKASTAHLPFAKGTEQ